MILVVARNIFARNGDGKLRYNLWIHFLFSIVLYSRFADNKSAEEREGAYKNIETPMKK